MPGTWAVHHVIAKKACNLPVLEPLSTFTSAPLISSIDHTASGGTVATETLHLAC